MAASAATMTDDAIGAKFARLAARWRDERGPESSITRISMHPAYQQIIGMGDAAVPLILQELERAPDHWFWALNAIIGVDPVPESGRGVMSEMVKAWLEWGTQHGYRRSAEAH
jgi:hypothetical protein